MKISRLLIVSLLGVMILAACGGGDSGSAPTDVVESVVDAMQTLDVEKASEFFCDEMAAEMDDSLTEGFAELEEMGLDPDELLEAFKLNMDGLKYEEKSKEGDEAVVHVSGNMSLEFDIEKLKEFFKKTAEASGQEVSDQELEFIVGIFESMGGQETPLEGDVKLIKEDGDWVVCDELDFLDSSELFQMPFP